MRDISQIIGVNDLSYESFTLHMTGTSHFAPRPRPAQDEDDDRGPAFRFKFGIQNTLRTGLMTSRLLECPERYYGSVLFAFSEFFFNLRHIFVYVLYLS